jgi:hypothetical protein
MANLLLRQPDETYLVKISQNNPILPHYINYAVNNFTAHNNLRENSMRNKFEQLIEYIINEETEKANELFHNLVVEKSRDIYNELVAEEMGEEMDEAGMSMDATDDMMGDIAADEEGMDHEDGETHDEEHGEHGMDMDDEEGEGELEDRVVDIEDALDELKAEFEKLMADEAGEEAHSEMPEEGVMREYVEKVAAPGNTEGQGAGAGSIGGATNTKSTVAGKNDMGGSAKNIANGGADSAPEGSAYKGPSNEYSKGEGKLPGSGGFENVPGAKAGKAFSNAKKPVTSEPAGVNKKSTLD